MYRPPSKSESFIYENSQKGSYFELASLASPPLPSPPLPPLPLPLPPLSPHKCLEVLHFLYPFLFHITLISVFETIFFFTYVSTLEDNGILNTIQEYVNPLLNGCTNWTTADRTVALEILDSILNTTTLSQQAAAATQYRATINNALYHQSWIYVGGLAGSTTLFTGILVWNKLQPNWKKLLTEQLSMVLLLGVYEWIFFRTIVLPYKAISATELNQYVVQELDIVCQL
jgi:hypothetical protein